MSTDVVAWMTEDGERVVPAKTMEGAKRDGGAMLSSMQPYTVALVRQPTNDAAVAAIEFALNLIDRSGLDFLQYWNQGDFDVLRKEWPEAPETVYIGADPLHPETKV